MKRSDAFPGNYISKEDVETPLTLTVASVTREEINDGDDGKKTKTVIHFTESAVMPMICNGTNWDAIAELYGDDSDDWTGKSIELYHDPKVMFGNKRVGGIRVRAPQGGQSNPLDTLRAQLKSARAELKAAGFEPEPLTQAQVLEMTSEQLQATLDRTIKSLESVPA